MRYTLLLMIPLVTGCKACHTAPPDLDLVGDAAKTDGQAIEAAKRELEANFARVHFEYDSARLAQDGRDALAANAAILGQHPSLQVEVQGHADERGTIEYNLALGERRAAAVVAQLSAMGVSSSRLRVVTFGEERPLASGSDEVVWAQNRRAEFRVLTADAGVRGTVGG